MVVIFYDEQNNINVFSNSGNKQFNPNDSSIMDFIPEDETIYYVQNVDKISKNQLSNWLNSVENTNYQESTPTQSNKIYLCGTGNGTVIIEDYKTVLHPEGLTVNGKWNFVDITKIYDDLVDSSNHFRILLSKNKIKTVDENYYRQNKHRSERSSPTERELNSILVPHNIRATDAVNRSKSNSIEIKL